MKVYLDNGSLIVGTQRLPRGQYKLSVIGDKVNIIEISTKQSMFSNGPVLVTSLKKKDGTPYVSGNEFEALVTNFFNLTLDDSTVAPLPPDVSAQLTRMEDEINRLKTHPGSLGGNIYSYNGGTAPTLADSKPGYYLTMHDMQSPQNIVLPSNVPSGAVLSINNQQGSDTPVLTFSNEPGGTIDGVTVDRETIPDSSIVFLIKTDSGWTTGFSGLIPKSLDTIIEAIKLKLTSSIHTISDIEAALRDKLHTFAEIRNEGFIQDTKMNKPGKTVYPAKQIEVSDPLTLGFDQSSKKATLGIEASKFTELIKMYGANGRVRFDDSSKHFFFEVLQNGAWVKKMEVGASIIVDTVKFIESPFKPNVKPGELGMYSKMVTVPSHDGSAQPHQALRPFFVLENGEEVAAVGVWDDQLRIPQKDGSSEYAAFKSELTPIISEVDRLKTNLSPADALPTYAWRGRNVPVLPLTTVKKYKAYYIHTTVLSNNAQSINIPTGLDEGTILSIENNDRSNYLTIRPPLGETLNSNSGSYQAQPDTLSFFIKVGSDWVSAFSGVFPNTMSSLKSTIQTLLPNELNTIDEIAAQLKDRLHTFREIQNEFSSQLHTIQDLETDGFERDVFLYGFVDNKLVPTDKQWIINQSRLSEPLSIPAQNKGSKYLALAIPPMIEPLILNLKVDNNNEAFTSQYYTGNSIPKRILITNNKFDTSNIVRIEFEIGINKVVGTRVKHLGYGYVDSDSNPLDVDFGIATMTANEEVTVPAQNNGDKFLAIYIPSFIAALVSEIKIDTVAKETSQYNVVDLDKEYTVFIVKDALDTTSTYELAISYHSRDTVSGIELDDGIINIAGVRKINIKGAKLENQAANEVNLINGINIHMDAPDQQYGNAVANELIVMPPLNVWDDNSDPTRNNVARMEIKPGTFEPIAAPGYLGYVSGGQEIIGKIGTPEVHHKGSVWFDDVIVPGGSYIFTDKANKAYGIQDYSSDDPNVTGGVNFLVVFRVGLKGKAPDNGMIRIALANKGLTPFDNGVGYLNDVNGDPMAVERHYKVNEELSVLEIAGIVNAKGLTEFRCIIADDFTNDTIVLNDRTENGTCLMIQSIGHDKTKPGEKGKTGDALQQFELDTMQNIEFASHYFGVDRMTLAWVVRETIPIKVGPAKGSNVMADGFSLYNLYPMRAGVQNGYVALADDGVNVCDFYFGKIFDSEETMMLRGKTIDVTATIVDKDNGFNVALMKWTGTPDEYTQAIYANRNNDALVFNTGWSESDTMFIPEDSVSGDHSQKKTFTVPSDANNYAIVIYPVEEQRPVKLKLKELKVDVNPAFTGFALKAPELANELHLEYDNEYKEFIQDNQDYASLRYTLNNTPADGLPMPCGIPGKGKALISLDNTVNTVVGSGAKGGEGAIKFDVDGTATINTDLLIWNEKSTPNTVTFWWAEVSADGQTFTKIADSETTFTVPKNSNRTKFKMKTFTLQAETGDRIALRASASVADGAYIESTSPSSPMVITKINFKELVDSSDAPLFVLPEDFNQNDFDINPVNNKISIPALGELSDRLDNIDDEIRLTEKAKQQGWYIELDVTDDGVPVLSPKKK